MFKNIKKTSLNHEEKKNVVKIIAGGFMAYNAAKIGKQIADATTPLTGALAGGSIALVTIEGASNLVDSIDKVITDSKKKAEGEVSADAVPADGITEDNADPAEPVA